jgi:cytoskeletal protein CcmA (bactofilin family)
MFSKTTNPTSGPAIPTRPTSAPSSMEPNRPTSSAPTARPTARVASVLGPDLIFEGSISGEGELLIDGAVKGDVHVSRLVIGEHAHVEGTVRGALVEVRGRVMGNVEGKVVHLLQTAHVEGDITHEKLSIDVGAFFQGRCAQFRPQAAAAPQPVAEVISLDAHQA